MSKIYEALEHAQKERKGLDSATDISFPEKSELEPKKYEMEEEMIGLYQTIESFMTGKQKKILQFIGSTDKEGTSTVAREFARISATKFDKTVLLLDADGREPNQCDFFDVKAVCDWEETMRNNQPVDRCITRIGSSRLYISLVSKQPDSVAQVFDSKRFAEYWDELKQRFDMILVDSVPATTSPDGFAIARKVDGVILVLEAERTRWPVAESVKNTIIKNGGNILGIVFNKRRYHIPEAIYRRL